MGIVNHCLVNRITLLIKFENQISRILLIEILVFKHTFLKFNTNLNSSINYILKLFLRLACFRERIKETLPKKCPEEEPMQFSGEIVVPSNLPDISYFAKFSQSTLSG
jgi:hypothetical protein